MLLLLALVAVSSANVIHDGKCPELKPVENFNLTAFQGTWYEVSKYPYDAEKKGKCATAEYKLEDKVLKVKNTHVVDSVQTYIEGTVKLADDANNAAKLVVTLKYGEVTKDSPLMILATDYSNYAIAYNCKNDDKNKNHQAFAWIMTRNKKLEGDAKTAVDNFLKANSKELDATKFLETDFSEEACKFNSTSLITEPLKS